MAETATETWQDMLPADFTVEQDGKPTPAREVAFVKEAKDLPGFVKQAIDAHREIGARVRIPGKDAKPEEITAFKQRITDAGILPVAPKDIAEYEISKPASLPEGLGWNDEWAKEFSATLLKHGASKELAKDLLALHEKVTLGTSQVLNTSFEQGMAALRAEHGDKFEERAAVAGRLANSIFTNPQELALFEAMGLGNHPGFLNILMRLAPLAEADSTFLAGLQRPGGEMTGDEARNELAKVISDKTHPHHEGYLRGDKAAREYVDEIYRKAYGTAKVQIT